MQNAIIINASWISISRSHGRGSPECCADMQIAILLARDARHVLHTHKRVQYVGRSAKDKIL